MIEITYDELQRVLKALNEVRYYDPDYNFVDEVEDMLLNKMEVNNESS